MGPRYEEQVEIIIYSHFKNVLEVITKISGG